MHQETTIHLHPSFFPEKERILVEKGELSAVLARTDTGVDTVRISNSRGHLLMLPFQGQQIWDAAFDGRTLTMKSMFTRPCATRDYLGNYGGFLLHCGLSSMGVPMGEDTHPLHGELPNAPYQGAWLVVGEDAAGPYIGLGGEYRHTVAFNCDYTARPLVKLHAGAAVFPVRMEAVNRKKTPMETMYMAHVNFRPVDGGKLVYSAPCTPKDVRVRKSIPSHVKATESYREFLRKIEADPSIHNVLKPGLAFDPEVVFTIDYRAGADGWARTMMLHPDGFASCIRHKPAQLDKGIRWICRTPDQDAAGILLPATAEPEGYHAEKAKGNLKTLAAGAAAVYEMEIGLLAPAEARTEEERIRKILA